MLLLNKLLGLKDAKSKIVVKNAFYSIFTKGINLLISFLTIPIVLGFLNTTQYGIWLTLTAILTWFSLFDLGFGNGLRNHLTIAISRDNYQEGKIYVSTTYAALTGIFTGVLLFFFIINSFINWAEVFNAPIGFKDDLNGAILYAISLLFLQFVLRLISTVLLAFQKSALADFLNMLSQVSILIGLYLLKILGYHSLTSVSVVYSLAPVLVFLAANILLFSSVYKKVYPSFSFVKLTYARNLLHLGINFFIIQVSALILFASDNFIIAHLFVPADVATYNISYKYFSIINVMLGVFLTPFWSMTTQSYANSDWLWIRQAMRKLYMLWLLLLIAGGLMFVLAEPVYKIWTHNLIVVPFNLSAVILLYFVTLNWSVIHSNFLNAIGKIKIQLYFSIFGMILNIPLAIFFVKIFHLGIIGVPCATIITMIIGNIFQTIQYKKIIDNKAVGVWNQ